MMLKSSGQASHPDVAIIHVQAADMYGNCIIRGTDCTCAEIAMASAHTIVTCEQLLSHELVVTRPIEKFPTKKLIADQAI